MVQTLTVELASHFARLALGHVAREFPNKLDHVLEGAADVKAPRELHPIFFGSFDWHSCVHGHWLLARLHRLFPRMPESMRIVAHFDSQFTAEKVTGELSYLERPSARGFERPYGWAWILALQGELLCHTSGEGRRWAAALAPLADELVRRFAAYLPLATYPVRAGVHGNSAFALLLARGYAAVSRNAELAGLCAEAARRWYASDRDCAAWEPSQDEFLSPALIEAALMQDVLSPEEFTAWFGAFLPRASQGAPATLFSPALVSDRSDGKIAHLDGLNLSRAWCWKRVIGNLAPSHPLRAPVEATISAHLSSALAHVTGDYMGEHWLASFALLALDPAPIHSETTG